jgi:hypothetical protein
MAQQAGPQGQGYPQGYAGPSFGPGGPYAQAPPGVAGPEYAIGGGYAGPSFGPGGPYAPSPGIEQALLMEQARRAPQSLGLGLGLGPRQRQGFMEAAQAGGGAGWLGEHPGIQRRIERRVEPGSEQAARIERFTATGQPQRPGGFGAVRGAPKQQAFKEVQRGVPKRRK